MSTTGKVLCVLVILAAVPWMLLTAAVSQLNHNGAEAVEKLKTDVAKLDSDLEKATRDLQKAKDDWAQDQVVTQNTLTVLEARQTDLAKAKSTIQEISSRVALQLADAESNDKNAAINRDQRIAQKKAEIDALAKAKAEVESLKTERTELVNRLSELREKFKTTLQENRSLTDRVQKKDSNSGASRPVSRPASFSR